MNLALLSCLLVLGLSPTTAHKFEDGFVERTMAIVIRGKTASVEYSVGLNATTVRDILEQWDHDASKRASGKRTSTAENNEPGSSSPQQQNTEALQSDPNSVKLKNQRRSNSNLPDARSKQGAPAPSRTDSAPAVEVMPDRASAHQIEAELLARFKQRAPQEIANRIELSCDGRRIVPDSITAGHSPLHSFILVVKFEFEMPVGENVDLKIRDENFRAKSGAVRYALKAKGSTMLLKSNKAPILVRSERVELADMTPEQRDRCTTIVGRLAIFEKNP